ncbi:hypothetical protein K437DRAFT_274453 [Tilletiaria anomala UBC 951]|uniref:Uncharacterized protein n=1 Tax=Tilletiaria anomala (strain ATCC 24038 / CBS 436.72 / UBC 951) TaxID=1037660 RepID=A0A066VTE6_TILAU|nr:uncharacterized protein K437DRAFT_274453 [Tilletiaria anomala UBC 951]KDN44746.1 hypothetical protein K437DRAFT_274453 [Tilletiaria anomala UBC 951]
MTALRFFLGDRSASYTSAKPNRHNFTSNLRAGRKNAVEGGGEHDVGQFPLAIPSSLPPSTSVFECVALLLLGRAASHPYTATFLIDKVIEEEEEREEEEREEEEIAWLDVTGSERPSVRINDSISGGVNEWSDVDRLLTSHHNRSDTSPGTYTSCNSIPPSASSKTPNASSSVAALENESMCYYSDGDGVGSSPSSTRSFFLGQKPTRRASLINLLQSYKSATYAPAACSRMLPYLNSSLGAFVGPT